MILGVAIAIVLESYFKVSLFPSSLVIPLTGKQEA